MEKETTEETFTYDLTVPISRRTTGVIIWLIIERNTKRLGQRKYLNYFSANKIRSALFDIKNHIIKTNIVETQMKDVLNVPILLYKAEFRQIMDSIQARGVIYTLLQLSDEQKRKGVIAISTGHFAHILSYFGKEFGIPVTVVMPSSTAHETVDKCRGLSATVIVQGDNMVDVHRIALCNARTSGLVYIDGNDHPNMIIGQATLGIEILEQVIGFDVIILPTMIDGCGLSAAIAVAVRESNPNIKIIEVQADLHNYLIDVRKITQESTELNVPTTCTIAYVNSKTIQKGLFDLTIFISKTDVQNAVDFLKEHIVDYYGATAIAGIRSGRLKDFIIGKRVLIPLFGKTDFSMLFASSEPSLEPRAGPSTSSS